MEAALDGLLIVIQIDEDNLECNRLIGSVLLAVQQQDLAEQFLYIAIKLSNWTDVSSLSNLAESMRARGDYELAIKIAAKGLHAVNQSDPTGLLSNSLGLSYLSLQNYSLAAGEFYLR